MATTAASPAQQHIDEKTFTRAFLSLLHTSTGGKLQDDYVRISMEPRPLVPMAEMPVAKKKPEVSTGSASESVQPVKVNLKSIKGVKFSTTIENKPTDTVYTLKEALIKDQNLDSQGYTPSNVRLLVKGKVQLDSKKLSEIDSEEISMTVMLSAPEKKEPATDTAVELTSEDWNAIKSLLVERLGDEAKASNALARLQKGWN